MSDRSLGRIRFDEARHRAAGADQPRMALSGALRVAALQRGVRRVEHRRLRDLRGAGPYFDFGP